MASINHLLSEIDNQSYLFSGHGPEWQANDAEKWVKVMF